MRSLIGKHAIITGGSRGIGLAIAKRFAADGASITLVGRDAATLERSTQSLPSGPPQSLEGNQPVKHDFYAFDVGSNSGWTTMLSEMKSVSFTFFSTCRVDRVLLHACHQSLLGRFTISKIARID